MPLFDDKKATVFPLAFFSGSWIWNYEYKWVGWGAIHPPTHYINHPAAYKGCKGRHTLIVVFRRQSDCTILAKQTLNSISHRFDFVLCVWFIDRQTFTRKCANRFANVIRPPRSSQMLFRLNSTLALYSTSSTLMDGWMRAIHSWWDVASEPLRVAFILLPMQNRNFNPLKALGTCPFSGSQAPPPPHTRLPAFTSSIYLFCRTISDCVLFIGHLLFIRNCISSTTGKELSIYTP